MTQTKSAAPQSEAPTGVASPWGRALSAGEIIEEAIREDVEALGFEVVAVDWAGAPRHRVVRVYLDIEVSAQVAQPDSDPDAEDGSKPRGITLDDITRMSPVVSNALDAAEAADEATELQRLLKNGYTLEVSSPGVERPLSKGVHFTRFIGRRITVRTFEPLEPGSKQKNFHGYVKAHEPDPVHPDDPRGGSVVMDEADGAGELRIPLTAIKRAHLVFED